MNVGIPESFFDLLDFGIELNLRVSHADVSYALRINKDDVLFVTDQQPQNEVGMEIAGLEESDTPSTAQVSQKVELSAFEEAVIIVMECF